MLFDKYLKGVPTPLMLIWLYLFVNFITGIMYLFLLPFSHESLSPYISIINGSTKGYSDFYYQFEQSFMFVLTYPILCVSLYFGVLKRVHFVYSFIALSIINIIAALISFLTVNWNGESFFTHGINLLDIFILKIGLASIMLAYILLSSKAKKVYGKTI
ncbi:hypothetical protein B9G39_09875 [Zooshikella ganghwensis]|uniref:Uncharacterized protein n=1 Tax=Zooshikella ganghwensis TaxID=202772 RepID=A0A4P9VMW0_9GAMM|nr:hypothetical protein B9G39_09875 [Zooshikella ganghwensis]